MSRKAQSLAGAPASLARPPQAVPASLRSISVRGARTHNLKNIDVDLPRQALVVITGLSGSGKSSLAFDTLYAEGQRRYVESLSTYARQFLQLMDKPDVDVIEGLSPAIAIEQKATSHNPRSTVGTVTEIHDYLRLLFARAGVPHCPDHGLPLEAHTVSQMVDRTLALPEGRKFMLLAPVARQRKGEFAELLQSLQAQGFVRFRVDGLMVDAADLPALKKNERHDMDVVVDRFAIRASLAQRLAESFEVALRVSGKEQGARVLLVDMENGQEHRFSARFACPLCSYTVDELEPRLFSFNSPQGACPDCDGLGATEVFDEDRVVAFPELSLAGGAIKGWDARNPYYHSMLQSVLLHFGLAIDLPFEKLPDRARRVVLHGSGEEAISFRYTMESGGRAGKALTKKHPFEGVIPNMMRRWRETDSSVVREELGKYRQLHTCPTCKGSRLRREAMHVMLGEGEGKRGLGDINRMTLDAALRHFQSLELQGARAEIAKKVIFEIGERLRFLNDVGLGYLSLGRSAETLSGGEAQRIRLASQIGSGLSGVMYVLDEPSIGLHQRDNDRLIATLQRLRDLGNSVIVVEHDEDMIRAADYVLDLGPGAGVHGGRIMAQGRPEEVQASAESLTGQYLRGQRQIAVPKKRHIWQVEPPASAAGTGTPDTPFSRHARMKQACAPVPAGHPLCLHIKGARGHNLKNVEAQFPLGLLTCVTGVSGSGKSTLVNDTLYAVCARQLHRSHDEPTDHDSIDGMHLIDKVINVDQSPIGRTPRSNPATYTGLFTPIRELMAESVTAKERGYTAGRFSFNVAGGRCEACQGDGVVKVEMHFLPDVYVPCDICQGKRYNRETLEISWKGKTIADILAMTVEEAAGFFASIPSIARKLQTLLDVGLSYITLGQSATTLSGGEAQRVKLALELSRRDTGRTLYVLDEPTTGLHFADIELLLKVLQNLRDAGNTIVIIEHNLDVIKTADWIIDMGPEGGQAGGQIVATGTPETLARHPQSHTGRYLQKLLARR